MTSDGNDQDRSPQDQDPIDTDRLLVAACLDGDELAWSTLVNRYKRLVYHFPNKANLSADECDDVFQETFLALYNQLKSIENKTDLSYWLSKVAQRTTWKLLQFKSRSLDEQLDQQDPADLSQIQDRELLLKLQQFKIRKAVLQLDGKCRILLTRLFYEVDESDYRELAEHLGIAMGSVGPTRNRCLLKLKKILHRMGIDEKNVSTWF